MVTMQPVKPLHHGSLLERKQPTPLFMTYSASGPSKRLVDMEHPGSMRTNNMEVRGTLTLHPTPECMMPRAGQGMLAVLPKDIVRRNKLRNASDSLAITCFIHARPAIASVVVVAIVFTPVE